MSQPFNTVSQTVTVWTLRTQDTSDLRQFGTISLVPKCLTFLCRSAEVSQHFMKGPKCLRHFGTSAEVSRADRGAFMFLYHFTTSRCAIHCHLPTASQDILYIQNHTRTFTFDSLTLLRLREQFRWWWRWWWSSSSWWSSIVRSKNSAEH